MKTDGLVRGLQQLKETSSQSALIDSLIEVLESPINEVDAPEIKRRIEAILVPFWQAKIIEPVPEHFEQQPEILDVIKIQEHLGTVHSLIRDLHHPYFYHQYLNQYERYSDFSFSLWQPLLNQACRIFGYKRKQNDNDYPFSHIKTMTQSRYTKDHLSLALTYIGVLLYIAHYLLKPEQFALLPNLIHCRENTTDEERCSEQALMTVIYHEPIRIGKLLKDYEAYITGRELVNNEEIKLLKHVIPKSLSDLKSECLTISSPQNAPKRYELYDDLDHDIQFQMPLVEDISSTTQVTHHSKTFIEELALRQPNASIEQLYAEALKSLNTTDDIDYDAMYKDISVRHLVFYIEKRKKERPHGGFSFFSEDTKCMAAQKMIDKLNGQVVEFSLWQKLALHEGRLGELVATIESSKPPTV